MADEGNKSTTTFIVNIPYEKIVCSALTVGALRVYVDSGNFQMAMTFIVVSIQADILNNVCVRIFIINVYVAK